MDTEEKFSVYDSLVICHPQDFCTTWDFCTHYLPHVKGGACSCDSCEPCDFDTVVEHRKKIAEKAIAAHDLWWMQRMEKMGLYQHSDDPELTSLREMIISNEKWEKFKKGLKKK